DLVVLTVGVEARIGHRTDCVDAFNPELVTLRPRQVEHDAAHHGIAPLIRRSETGVLVRTRRVADDRVVVAVVAGANLVQCAGDLRRAPRLIHTQRTDDVRDLCGRVVADVHARSARRIAGRVLGRRARQRAQRERIGTGIPHRIATERAVFQREGGGEAVAERCRVGEHVHAGRAGRRRTADVAGVVVRVRIEVEVGLRTTDREARELDEGALDVVGAGGVVVRGPLEAGAGVGAQGAVLGLGADIEGRNEARTPLLVGRVDAIVTAAAARDVGGVRAARIEVGFGADPTTNLDASVGSGNVEEPGSVDAANLHVFYWFGSPRCYAARSPRRSSR